MNTLRPFKFWQFRFDDVNIRSQAIYDIKLNYIHWNPVKAGLVEDAEAWPYSSLAYYLTGKTGIITIAPA